jgi:hypothetical protein
MSAESDVLAALMDALRANAGVKAALGDPVRIFDDRPAGAAFPHAVIELGVSRPADSAGVQALEQEIAIEVFSRRAGKSEALSALAAMREALHDADIEITGRQVVLIQALSAQASRLDPQTIRGVLRLRVLTEAE